MDILLVRETVIEGIKKVREGNGPVFIESMAYRYHGHSMADPTNYRANSEVEEQRNRDPIDRFKALCLDEGLLTSEDISRIDEEIDSKIQIAVEFAEQSPEPILESLYTNIYAAPEA